MSKIRILLADDHRILRQGLRGMLETQQSMEVVGEAADGRTAVRLAAELTPDVIVMDISMADLNGIEATRQIRARAAERNTAPKVVALSAHQDRRMTAEMLRAGASGYVLKDSACEDLVRAVTAAMEGTVFLSPAVAGVVVDDYIAGGGGETSSSSAFASLSPRQREVLQLTAEGKAMKEIAAALQVSVKTVETHRRAIMERLGLYTVAELTKLAIREGLTTAET